MHGIFLTVILASCTTTGSAPPQAAGSGPGLLIQVARWQGPGSTVITLQPDGSLQRLEGSLLTLRRQGVGRIPAAAARSLLDRAEGLPGPGPVPKAPIEGDLFLIVTPAGRVLSASEATAALEMRAYIDEVLRATAAIPLRANTETYLRAQQVNPERTMRLRAAGRSAVAVALLGPRLGPLVQTAIRGALWFHPVDAAAYATLLQALGGRDNFVQTDEGTWYQLELWAPPQ